MGSCLSCQVTHPTAKLILDDGGLREFSEPVKVAEILNERPGFFVSHSDSMDFDQYLIPLSAGHQLQVGHLYFLLPQEKLQNPLPPSKMAALAVKAAAALQRKKNKNNRRKRRRCKIMPEMEHSMDGSQILEGFNHLKESPTLNSTFSATTVGDYRDLMKMKLTPIPEAFDYESTANQKIINCLCMHYEGESVCSHYNMYVAFSAIISIPEQISPRSPGI